MQDIKQKISLEVGSFIQTEVSNFPINIQLAFQHVLSTKSKCFRSYIFILSYLKFGGNTQDIPYKFSISFELFHNFVLVHDDLIDNSAKRRGSDSFHVRFGDNFALLFGDFLYTFALNFAHKHDKTNKALDVLLQVGLKTAQGAISECTLDVHSQADILNLYEEKTAYYSFFAPILLAYYYVGGKDKIVIQKIEEYSRIIGLAYQINDDLEDLSNFESFQEAEIFNVNLYGFLAKEFHANIKNREELYQIVLEQRLDLKLKDLIENLRGKARLMEKDLGVSYFEILLK
ncbi:MAG: hypothetical protein GY817_01740 [bacterium]|nr:hypothetical protein [bacterium]